MIRSAFILFLVTALLQASTGWADEGRVWWDQVAYLSSDQMQGRAPGSAGFNLAADYVANQFARLHLQPAGGNGFFQNVQFTQTSLVSCSIAIVRHRHRIAVSVPTDAYITYDPGTPPHLDAPIVFAGYGLRIPEAGYDDLRGLPLKGAIVAFLTGGPDQIPANLRAHYSSQEMRWRAMREAGAVGMLAISDPATMEMSWTRRAALSNTPQLTLPGAQFNHVQGLQFNGVWNPAKADLLFSGSGVKFEELLATAAANKPLPHISLPARLQVSLQISTRTVASKNVMAVHPGLDPALKNEYVVISAHLDHLGVDRQLHGDRIYNGAMDDASGVASILQIATMLRVAQTKRSIVYLLFTGEEEGELGSEYFAQFPPLKGRIVADLNLDMFLPLVPLRLIEVAGMNESSLAEDVRKVADDACVQVRPDNAPGSNRFIRSDQYSFVKMGVPALAFKFGYDPGSREEKIYDQWYATRYHGVRDDTNQPVDLQAAARFNRLLKDLLLCVADDEQTPHWNQNSFFRRFAMLPSE